MTLNAKQSKFVQEYLIDLNAKQAAIRAGYSSKTAEVRGSVLLRNVKVKEAIEKQQKKLSDKTEITQERVLLEYAKIAFLDPTDFFDNQGNLLDINDIPKESMAAVGGIDTIRRITKHDDDDPEIDIIKKIKLWDKPKALEALGRHLGLFREDNAQKGVDAISLLLGAIAERTKPIVKE